MSLTKSVPTMSIEALTKAIQEAEAYLVAETKIDCPEHREFLFDHTPAPPKEEKEGKVIKVTKLGLPAKRQIVTTGHIYAANHCKCLACKQVEPMLRGIIRVDEADNLLSFECVTCRMNKEV